MCLRLHIISVLCEDVVVDIFAAAADGCRCFVSTAGAGAGAGLIPAICAKSQPVCWKPPSSDNSGVVKTKDIFLYS